MKQFAGQKQKWVLSLALLAVLGTQSYFQVSSNTLGSMELASRAPADATDASATSKKDEKTTTASAKQKESAKATESSKNVSKEILEAKDKEIADLKKENKEAKEKAAATEERLKKVEGTLTQLGCKDGSCDTDFVSMMKKVLNPITAVTDKALADKDQGETPKERRERLAKERKEEREAKLAAKKEKEEEKAAIAQEKKDIINDEFEESMKAINEECSESSDGPAVQCIGEKMAELLKKVSKDKDKKPDNKVVQKAFATYFSKAFVVSLQDPSFDMSGTLDAIMKDIPNEYSILKNQTMKSIETVTGEQTRLAKAEIKKNVDAALLAKRQNNPIAADQYMANARSIRDAIRTNADITKTALVNDATEVKDFNALNYLRQNYVPNIEALMVSLDRVDVTTPIATEATRVNSRGGTVSNILNNNANTLNNVLQNNNGSFHLNNATNIGDGISVGAPTQQRQIQRGARQ